MNELEIVEWARRRARAHSSLLTGIGDDMAVVGLRGSQVLVSSDLLLDGVHFDSKVHAPAQIGRKAVARALSDCAAMAVEPVALLISVALPKSWTSIPIKELFEVMVRTAEEFDLAVAGGDTARWNGMLAIDISVAAQPYLQIQPVRRDGALVGDSLYVTGPLGGSILGKHLSFTPRIHEALAVAKGLGRDLHAMIDISDGLALDLWRICQASGTGAALDENLLSGLISSEARACAARDNIPAIQHLLFDGEDYELLLAASPSANTAGLPLHPIGTIYSSGLRLIRANGQSEELQPHGYVH